MAIFYRNRDVGSEKAGLYVSGHIIWPFTRVNERRIFGAQLVGSRFQIDSDIRVGVLVNRQTGRSVLDENIQQPNIKLPNLGNCIHDLSGHQMESS